MVHLFQRHPDYANGDMITQDKMCIPWYHHQQEHDIQRTNRQSRKLNEITNYDHE